MSASLHTWRAPFIFWGPVQMLPFLQSLFWFLYEFSTASTVSVMLSTLQNLIRAHFDCLIHLPSPPSFMTETVHLALLLSEFRVFVLHIIYIQYKIYSIFVFMSMDEWMDEKIREQYTFLSHCHGTKFYLSHPRVMRLGGAFCDAAHTLSLLK